MSQFFGYIGLFNGIILLPIVLVLHFTKVESLVGLSWPIIISLFINGIFNNVLSDYLWARSMLLTRWGVVLMNVVSLMNLL